MGQLQWDKSHVCALWVGFGASPQQGITSSSYPPPYQALSLPPYVLLRLFRRFKPNLFADIPA